MARTVDVRKLKEWRGRLAQFERSQLSIVQFCREEGVSVASFYQWRKKLQQEPGPAVDMNNVAAEFKPVRVVGSPSIAVRLPGGTQLEVPTSQPQVLQLALQTLARLDAQRMAGGEPC